MRPGYVWSLWVAVALLGVTQPGLHGQAPAGTAFTYQGRLAEGGNPASGAYDFEFRLFDADGHGNQLGHTITVEDKTVQAGLFTVTLDFGPQFTGNACWLQVAVRAGDSHGDYTVLDPRQPITATPYAIRALTGSGFTLPYAGSFSTAEVPAFKVTHTGSQAQAIMGEATGDRIYAIYGSATGEGCIGVRGESDALASIAVSGYANATGDVTHYGGLFQAKGNSGRGVYANASATTGANYGLYARSMSTAGYGVYGLAGASTGTNYGVYGMTNSHDGYAGYFAGRGYFGSFVGIGVLDPTASLDIVGTARMAGFQLTATPTAGYVLTADANGIGTWQPAPSGPWQLSGSNIYYSAGNVGIGTASPSYPLHVESIGHAGYFKCTTGGARAVAGQSTATLGTGYGVYGSAASQAGSGVYGVSTTTSGTGSGVCGESQSAIGRGVYGENYAGGWGGYFKGKGYFSGHLGIGTEEPTQALDVNGTAQMTGFRLGSSATAGHILTTDASGVGTWQPAPSGFALPYSGSASSASPALQITNTGAGPAVQVAGAGTYLTNAALYVANTNSGGISIASTSTSGDANLVVVNKGVGDLIRGFSGAAGENRVFQVENDGTTSVHVLRITGGADLAEPFKVGTTGAPIEPGMVVCIDPDNPGKLVVSSRAYDRTVAGVISGAGGVQPGMTMGQRDSVASGTHPVALTGRVYVRAEVSGGAIEPGDLLTTSAVPGHAMKASDYDRSRGATLGKAMSRLAEGRGLVLMLVQPQ